MDILVVSTIFVLGLIIGSFLNVVILRWNTGLSASTGRSLCFCCGKELAWYELLPVLSFAVQGGRCRSCAARISWQYPLVELATGALFVLAYRAAPDLVQGALPLATFIVTASLFALYVVIFVYDLRHTIIPDAFSYSAGLAALALIGLDWLATGSLDFGRMAAGPLLFLFFYLFWRVSKGAWMGLGDGKLALSIGWTLGLSSGFAALLMSFWIGAAASLVAMAFSRRLGLRSAVPFAPFLLIGFLIAFALRVDIPTILSHLAL